MTDQLQFANGFDKFVVGGDTLTYSTENGVYDFTARVEYDTDATLDDDDVHNAEVNPEAADDIAKVRNAWHNDEWFYCGIVVSVTKGEWKRDFIASLWSIEANYPNKDGQNNDHLTDVANELLNEALAELRKEQADHDKHMARVEEDLARLDEEVNA